VVRRRIRAQYEETVVARPCSRCMGLIAACVVVVRRTLRRAQVVAWFAKLPRCLVGIEACTTAHYWGRELARLGHDVRLIPLAYAKAYVRRIGWALMTHQDDFHARPVAA
jgi:transposase